MRRRNDITGLEMRVELAAKGWLISERTAVRVLFAARNESSVRLSHKP